jgi:hypothetical protein
MLKNNAPTPYPSGNPTDSFTSNIMKIIINSEIKHKTNVKSKITKVGSAE